MSRAKDVPRAKDGCVHAALPQEIFALGAHLYIGLHHGCWMRDAEIDEVMDAGLRSSTNGAAGGDEVDAAELGSFGGAGMGDSDQLNEGVGGLDLLSVGVAVESITENWLATGRELVFGSSARKTADFVTAAQELSDQRASKIAGAAGYEDGMFGRWHSFLVLARRTILASGMAAVSNT